MEMLALATKQKGHPFHLCKILYLTFNTINIILLEYFLTLYTYICNSIRIITIDVIFYKIL